MAREQGRDADESFLVAWAIRPADARAQSGRKLDRIDPRRVDARARLARR